jgi:CRP/FNR family transcriptional regulator
MTRERLSQAMEASDLFAGISSLEKTALLEISRTRWLPKNSLLFSQGEAAEGFFLIVTGRVKVFKMSQEGKEQILHIFGPGEIVGEVPVFSGRGYPASAVTLKDSELLYIPREGFLRLATDQPQILLNMLATLSRRLRTFTVQIERLTLMEVASRLAEVLLEIAGRGSPGQQDVAELKVTKGQLANQIGTTPETLSRSLQKMSRKGMIRVNRNRVAILDREALQELATGGSPLDP